MICRSNFQTNRPVRFCSGRFLINQPMKKFCEILMFDGCEFRVVGMYYQVDGYIHELQIDTITATENTTESFEHFKTNTAFRVAVISKLDYLLPRYS